ncbi:Sb-PDE family phosphodiesterase [Phenylobacterium sp.]|uniref:Sb-PDE family phosphodiesterase n=1 Tax=Phenylobacterium sp. TaxID=1871053 RepID=UPI0026205022|nr:Sb-PDE family phosphodiesterase [Phenylobacterium sp.]
MPAPRLFVLAAALLAASLAPPPTAAQAVGERTWTRANDSRTIEFPTTAKGNKVLAIDTHTHTLFSDGVVWPTVRLWEAEQDHLAAYAVTDHLEYRPYLADVPSQDHNRPYRVAATEAARIKARAHVVPGVEITRHEPYGHFNALFLTDANALPVDTTLRADPRETLKAARAQGAFIIWNHAWVLPGLEPGAADPLPAYQREILAEGLFDAMEVANSWQVSNDAFQTALTHGLAVIGASDVHTLIDTDTQIPEGQHRTVTLVLAADESVEGLRQALFAKRTAVLYRQSLYGREAELSEIVGAALRMPSRKRVTYFLAPDVVEVELTNDASIPLLLRFTSGSPISRPGVVTIPPHGALAVQFAGVADVAAFAPQVEVLNAFVAPDRPLVLTLR